MNYFLAFLTGGLLCAVAQIFIDKTQLTPARILTGYVVSGVFLTGIGLYEPIVRFGGCGATVPISGFGYCLAQGVQKAVNEKGLIGAFTGGLSASSAGICAVLLFTLFFCLFFRSKPDL